MHFFDQPPLKSLEFCVLSIAGTPVCMHSAVDLTSFPALPRTPSSGAAVSLVHGRKSNILTVFSL